MPKAGRGGSGAGSFKPNQIGFYTSAPTTGFTKQTIHIQVGGGTQIGVVRQPVEAVVKDGVAVHRNLDDTMWVVSDARSGMMYTQFIRRADSMKVAAGVAKYNTYNNIGTMLGGAPAYNDGDRIAIGNIIRATAAVSARGG